MTTRSLFTFAALAGLVAFSVGGQALAQTAAQGRRPGGFGDLATGEAVYKNICQGCHMPDGKGAVGAGAYPALAANAKLKVAAYPVLVVTRGQRAMPEFGSSLTNEQIAEVVTYIRSGFGNGAADKVAAADVAKMRPQN